MKKYEWMKTDTAAIMFSSLSSADWGRTCRIAAVLKDGEVDPVILRRALAKTIKRFPSFSCQLRHGFFWDYLEHTDALPELRCDSPFPPKPVTTSKYSHPDFRITYYKRRIAIECAHILADGMGILAFFSTLVAQYLNLTGHDIPFVAEQFELSREPSAGELENAFEANQTKDKPVKKNAAKPAYQLPAVFEKDYLNLVFGFMSIAQVKELSSKEGMTITEYLSCVLILAIIRSSGRKTDEPVVISVPVNLRRFFPTETVRNFTVEARISYEPCGKSDVTLEDICASTKGQLKEQITKENLQQVINGFCSLSGNPVIKIVPAFIKRPVLRIMQKKGHATSTTILTNLGECKFPKQLSDMLERVDAINGDTSKYGLPMSCSSLSINGYINMCFSMCNRDTSVCREFFRILTSKGIDVRIESTHGNGAIE